MNRKIRAFFEKIIALVNAFDDVPIEAKRMALFIALQLVERQSNEAIELEQEEKNAESIPEDKLAELSK